MNIDDLKSAWHQYDRKLESAREINERILIGMIRDRSETRFTRVKRYYQISILWMFVCLAVGVLVIVGNPFDYRYTIQYVPAVIFCGGLVFLLGDYIKTFATFQRVTLTQYNVDESLKRIIGIYERPRKLLRYIVLIFLFSQVVLLPLSFLPAMAERMGLGPALLERLIPIGIGAAMLYAAFKLGAFRDKSSERFRADLEELESLKRMSNELRSV